MKRMILVLSLFVAAPAFAADAQPAAKVAPAAKVFVPASAPAAKAPVPATKAPDPATKAPEKPAEAAPAPVEKKDAPDEVKWWEVLVQHAMELGFLILSLMATALVRVLGKKYGFAAHTDKVNDILMRAAGYAEQKAIKAAKLEEGKKTSGAEKMELAVQFAQRLAADYKVKDKGSVWWEEKLEAWLGVENGS
jgi:hypothetical protein